MLENSIFAIFIGISRIFWIGLNFWLNIITNNYIMSLHVIFIHKYSIIQFPLKGIKKKNKKKISRKFQDTKSKLTMFQNWLKLFAFSPIRKWNGHSMWQWTINTLTNDTPHNVSTLLITRVKYSFTFIFSKVSLILILISREENLSRNYPVTHLNS